MKHNSTLLILIALFFWTITFYSCKKSFDVLPPTEEEMPSQKDLEIEGVRLTNGAIDEFSFTTAKIKATFLAFQASTFTVTNYGHVVSKTEELPTIEHNDGWDSLGIRTAKGSFTSLIENLEPGTTYHGRVYVEKKDIASGEVTYVYHPKSISFTTKNPETPDVLTKSALDITESSFRLRGKITDFKEVPAISHGFIWSTSQMAPTLELNEGEDKKGPESIPTGSTSHDFEKLLDGLEQNKIYYCRTFAENIYGVKYGDVIEVKTTEPQAPIVLTLTLNGETESSFQAEGKIANFNGYNITHHGFVWSVQSVEPTLNDPNTQENNLGALEVEMEYDFLKKIEGLTIDETYYCRAYAINIFGDVGYGEILSIKTKNPQAPLVETISLSEASQNSFKAKGEITNFNGYDVKDHGFLLSEDLPDPEIGDPNVVLVSLNSLEQTSNPVFEKTIDGLFSNKNYYCRAFAKNWFEDIGYGFTHQITTLPPPSPNLEVTEVVLKSDSNNSGEANPGESIVLEVKISNIGNDVAKGVTTIFTSNSSYANIPSNSVDYGDILVGGNRKKTITVTIDDATPWDTSISLDVEMEDTEGNSWFETVSFTVYSPVVVLDNLIAYYTFDEQNGTEIINGYHATNNGNINFSTDRPGSEGYSASFSGMSADYFYRGSPHPLGGFGSNASATLSVWIKASMNGAIMGVGNSFCCSDYKFQIRDGNVWYKGTSGQFSNFDVTPFLLTGQWKLLTVTVQPGSDKLYVNGVEIFSTASSSGFYIGAIDTYPMFIGRLTNASSSGAFNGKMDNLRIYNRALSASEVMEIYNARQ